MDSESRTPDEIEVDRLLGNRALIKLDDIPRMGRAKPANAASRGARRDDQAYQKRLKLISPALRRNGFARGARADRFCLRQTGRGQARPSRSKSPQAARAKHAAKHARRRSLS